MDTFALFTKPAIPKMTPNQLLLCIFITILLYLTGTTVRFDYILPILTKFQGCAPKSTIDIKDVNTFDDSETSVFFDE